MVLWVRSYAIRVLASNLASTTVSDEQAVLQALKQELELRGNAAGAIRSVGPANCTPFKLCCMGQPCAHRSTVVFNGMLWRCNVTRYHCCCYTPVSLTVPVLTSSTQTCSMQFAGPCASAPCNLLHYTCPCRLVECHARLCSNGSLSRPARAGMLTLLRKVARDGPQRPSSSLSTSVSFKPAADSGMGNGLPLLPHMRSSSAANLNGSLGGGANGLGVAGHTSGTGPAGFAGAVAASTSIAAACDDSERLRVCCET